MSLRAPADPTWITPTEALSFHGWPISDALAVAEDVLALTPHGRLAFYLPPSRKYVGVTVEGKVVMSLQSTYVMWTAHAPEHVRRTAKQRLGQGWWFVGQDRPH